MLNNLLELKNLRLTLLGAFILLFQLAFAQSGYFGFQWAKSLSGKGMDYAEATAADAAGNVFIAGTFSDTLDANPDASAVFNLVSAGDADCYVVKLSASGQMLWALRFGGLKQDMIKSLHVDAWGNLLLTGTFEDTVDFDPGNGIFKREAPATLFEMFVLKLNNNGQFKWAKAFGNPNYESEACEDVTSDSVGNVYTAGYASNGFYGNPDSTSHIITVTGSTDAFVQKFDSNGTFLMAVNAGINNSAYAVAVDKNGFIVFAGVAQGGLNGYQLRVVKLRPNGTVLWGRETGSTSYDAANDLTISDDGTIYATGRFIGTVAFGNNWSLSSSSNHAPFLWKLTAAGSTVWAKEITGPWNSSKLSISTAMCFSQNNIFVAGQSYNNNTENGFICRYDTTGVLIFSTLFQSTQSINTNTDITNDRFGNIFVTNTFTRTLDFNPGDEIFNLTAAGTTTQTDPALIKFSPCQPSYDTLHVSSCNSYISPKGALKTVSGTFTEIIQNASGCDSNIVVYLTINNSFIFNVEHKMACDSFVSPSGKVIKTSGIFNDTLLRVNGCDSIYRFNLIVSKSAASIINRQSCGPFTIAGNTFTQSGVYNLKLNTAGGCDSNVTLILTVSTIDTSMVRNGNTFTANENAATYQWLRCDLGFITVSGATAKSFTPSQSGSYAVQLSRSGCFDTSYCFSFQASGIDETYLNDVVAIYPNPSKGLLHVNLKQSGFAGLKFFELNGKCVLEENLTNEYNVLRPYLPKGFYILSIITNDTIYLSRLVVE